MTDIQLYLAIGVPILFNAAMLTLIVNLLNGRVDAKIGGLDAKIGGLDAKIGGLENRMNARFDGLEKSVNARFDTVSTRLDAVNQRFDDMRDLWRSELHRVEEILDARLKHLEEERH